MTLISFMYVANIDTFARIMPYHDLEIVIL